MTYFIYAMTRVSLKQRQKFKEQNINLQYTKQRWHYVTYFNKLIPSMVDILIKEYGFNPTTRVKIQHSTVTNTPKWKNYRSKFKLFYSGDVEGLDIHIRNWFEKNVWKDTRKRLELKRLGIKRNVVTKRMERKLKHDIKTRWDIYYRAITPEDPVGVNEQVNEFMQERFIGILNKFNYYCNEELKRKPKTKEYRLFLKYKAYKTDYPPEKVDTRACA